MFGKHFENPAMACVFDNGRNGEPSLAFLALM